VVDRLNVPRRIADAVRRIGAMLPRLESGRAGRFAKTPLSALAHDVLTLRQAARGAEPPGKRPEPEPEAGGTRRRRRRRSRKRIE
jgi:poly(A) polymerase